MRAWARYAQGAHAGEGRRFRSVTHADIVAHTPDISPEDNQSLAAAAAALAGALKTVMDLVGESAAYRRMALRMFVKFAGEQVGEQEFERIMDGGRRRQTSPRRPAAGRREWEA